MKVQTMVPEQNLALNLNQHTSGFSNPAFPYHIQY